MRNRPFETNYAGAIYGTILSMAVVTTVSRDPDLGAVAIAGWTAATAFVFFLAHTYADIVAAGFARPGEAKQVARDAVRKEWPLVQGSLIPAAAMLLTPLGLVSEDVATYVAVLTGVVVLFVAGILIGTRENLSWGRRIIIGVINAAIGFLIVALKIFVH